MTSYAITPTDTRTPEPEGAHARIAERASPKLAADFNAACLRIGDRIARQVRESTAAINDGAASTKAFRERSEACGVVIGDEA